MKLNWGSTAISSSLHLISLTSLDCQRQYLLHGILATKQNKWSAISCTNSGVSDSPRSSQRSSAPASVCAPVESRDRTARCNHSNVPLALVVSQPSPLRDTAGHFTAKSDSCTAITISANLPAHTSPAPNLPPVSLAAHLPPSLVFISNPFGLSFIPISYLPRPQLLAKLDSCEVLSVGARRWVKCTLLRVLFFCFSGVHQWAAMHYSPISYYWTDSSFGWVNWRAAVLAGTCFWRSAGEIKDPLYTCY